MSRTRTNRKMWMTKKQRHRKQRQKWEKRHKKMLIGCACEFPEPFAHQAGHNPYSKNYNETVSYHLRCGKCHLTIRRTSEERCFKIVLHKPDFIKYIPKQFQTNDVLLAAKVS